MKKIVLDGEVARQPFEEFVRSLDPGEVQVVDSAGHVVAYLNRVPVPGDSFYRSLACLASADAQQAGERENEAPAGRTTAEVLTRLLSLDQPTA